jgi:hypothetical protein
MRARSYIFLRTWVAVSALISAWPSFGLDLDPSRHFTDKVKPLLESRCVSCHGPDKVKGGLRMDSRAALLKGGDNGPAIVPGKPDDSLILQAVMHSKKDLEMPPKEKLTTNDIDMLRQWIAAGAPWPENVVMTAPAEAPKPGERIGDAWTDKRNPIVRIFGGQRLDLWSLRPVGVVKPPEVKVISESVSSKTVATSAKGGARGLITDALFTVRSPRNPIDAFIDAKLVEKKLPPAPPADKRTLARRLHYDLTGLPPTPEQLDEFLRDERPGAYERLVDRLLASPRYGEHWARHWLDVVRYSDSNGFDWDEFRPRVWRFRDYVIRSFNADKPFDRFIREQLAGDELFDGAPTNAAQQDALIATGFLRLGPQDNSAALFNEQSRARHELLADLTETTASAFLGLTMSCARCHDHKFDPLSHADHFRLRAFFEPVKYADDTPLDLAAEQAAIRAHNKSLDEQIRPFQERRDGILDSVRKKLREELVAKLSAEERELLNTPKDKRPGALKGKIEGIEKKVEVKDKSLPAALSKEQKAETDALARQIDEIKKRKRPFTLGLLMTDTKDKVPPTRVLYQGDHKAEREAVVPGFISALDPNPAVLLKPASTNTTGRRLTLANWIASPANPLTARVFVNRVWQAHFGQGLVATANDFGLAGARPTHPELLDWLAGEFMGQGWSLKKLHRLIVTSEAYRRGTGNSESVISETVNSEVPRQPKATGTVSPVTGSLITDYSRRPLRRLTAEQLRDSLLAVSGLLKSRDGGPPVWPELPAEVLQANPAFLDDNETKTKGWYPSPKDDQNVRSVFLVQKKTVRVPFMETFDLPENSFSCPRRTESIVAPQALTLLNGVTTIEAARALAARVRSEAGETAEAQVGHAFARVLQRAPAPGERDACLALLARHGLAHLCRALLNVNEFLHLD